MNAAALALGCLLLAATPAHAQQIDRYTETVDIASSGDAVVTIDLDVPADVAEVVTIASGAGRIGAIETATLVAPDTQRALAALDARVTDDGRVDVRLARAAVAPAKLRLVAHVQGTIDMSTTPLAHGGRDVRYRLALPVALGVRRVEATLVLPPGLVAADVDDLLPAPADTEVTLPYRAGARDGRSSVTLDVAPRADGAVAMTIHARRRPNGPATAAALAIMAGAYLWLFRDLTRTPPAAAPAPEPSSAQPS